MGKGGSRGGGGREEVGRELAGSHIAIHTHMSII